MIGENVVPSGSMLVQVVVTLSAIDYDWVPPQSRTVSGLTLKLSQEISYDRPDTEICLGLTKANLVRCIRRYTDLRIGHI